MIKKILIGIGIVIIVGGALAYFNRSALLTGLALNRVKATHYPVGPTQDIVWDVGPQTADTPVVERPPNIIFIVLDDLGINDLSTFGGGVAGGRVPTPNIDALATEGALFTQAYSGSGTCAPSRAMLMTGRYPTRTGFEFTPTPPGMSRILSTIANGQDRGALPPMDFNREADAAQLPYDDMGLPGEEVTIAELLRGQDYSTTHIGKWHLGRNADMRPTAQGFDQSLLMHSLLYDAEDSPDTVNAKLEFDPIDQFLWARGQFAASFNMGEPFTPGGYLTDWWTDESLRVIEANRHRPFFLYLAHWGVHTPLQATREDYEAVGDISPHRLRVYAAMLRALDRSVGRIVAKLEEEGLADNTIVVLWSDHGWKLGEYRGWGKMTNYEIDARVPMIISARGMRAQFPTAGQRTDQLAELLDLFPTLCEMAQIATPDFVDGKSLVPVLKDVNVAVHDHSVSQYYRRNDGNAVMGYSIRTMTHRMIEWREFKTGELVVRELYDHRTDHSETTNLIDTAPESLVEELATLLSTTHPPVPLELVPEIHSEASKERGEITFKNESDSVLLVSKVRRSGKRERPKKVALGKSLNINGFVGRVFVVESSDGDTQEVHRISETKQTVVIE